jgi:hypothetical protein
MKKKCIMRSFIICIILQILLHWSNQKEKEMDRTCKLHGRYDKCIHTFGQKLEGRPRVDGRIILTWILQKYSVRMWIGFI